MCGRYVTKSDVRKLAAQFDARAVTDEAERLVPSYNTAPTRKVPGVVALRDSEPGSDGDASRVLDAFRWGLVPFWAKDPRMGSRMINARAESVREKPAFRRAFARQRCILPADGFYEWEKQDDGTRRPWYIRADDGTPLALAGLWEEWTPKPDAEDEVESPADAGDGAPPAPTLLTCTILTTGANALLRPIHDRMPAILSESDWGAWLDPANGDLDLLEGLLAPAPDDLLLRYEVGPDVGNVRNNRPDLLLPRDEAPGESLLS